MSAAKKRFGDAPETLYDNSEDGLAREFAYRHRDRLRYVAEAGIWRWWDGNVWKEDRVLATLYAARELAMERGEYCNDKGSSKSTRSKKVITNIEFLGRSDPQVAATVEQFDADDWLLNTTGGVVDLRTGVMRKARPGDMMTLSTAVAPGGDCPIWSGFLVEVTAGDRELIDYLQRVCGYLLVGSTQEHALFFIFGNGGNGKGVFLNTITGILGSLAAVAPMDAFVASTSTRHPTELAMLCGKRAVTAQETEEGRNWAEARVKAITGGDPITARFMRRDFFTYQPKFKLLVASNHKPGLRNVDDAMRRRLHLINFGVQIPAHKRDPELPEKLKAEWPGILKWMIEGCLAWQKHGLMPPETVKAAGAAYFEDQDMIENWLSECAVRGPNYAAGSSALFASWSAWAAGAGEHVGSQKQLSQKLEARGFTKARDGAGRVVFRGLTASIPTQNNAPRWQD